MRTIALLVFLLVGCSEARSGAWNEASDDRDLMEESWAGPDLQRGGRTYAQFDEERDLHAMGDFRGFGCLGSCDGHEAGYAWAAEQSIADPQDCDGNSWSFIEGCAAWAIEHYEPADDDNRPERGLF